MNDFFCKSAIKLRICKMRNLIISKSTFKSTRNDSVVFGNFNGGVQMIERILKSKMLSLAEKFQVIILTGQRQSGKTTLMKEV